MWEGNLRLLHPFMPFLTEELWQHMTQRSDSDALIVSSWPESQHVDAPLLNNFETAKEIIGAVRNFRKEKQLSFKEKLSLFTNSKEPLPFAEGIMKLGFLEGVDYQNDEGTSGIGGRFRVGTLSFFIPLKESAIDKEKERKKIRSEMNYAKGFLATVEKKLSNERFMNNARKK